MRKVCYSSVAFLAILSSLCYGQEKYQIEDIFRYLPEGYYYAIQYTSLHDIKKADRLDEYHILTRMDVGKMFPFLEDYTSDIEAVTLAVISNIEPGSLAESAHDIDEINKEESLPSGGTRITVLEIPNVTDIEKNLRAKGDVTVKVTLRKIPVYSAKTKEPISRDIYFACLVDEGYMLITSGIKYLRAMLKAGNGQSFSFLDGDDFKDLVTVLPDLGTYWEAKFYRPSGKVWLHTFLKRGESDRKIETLRKRIEKAPLLKVSTLYFDDEILEREYAVYASIADADDADPAGVFGSGNLILKNKDMTEHLKYIDSKRKYSKEGNCLISEIEINKEYLDKEKEYTERMIEYSKKLREEREQEKEARKQSR